MPRNTAIKLLRKVVVTTAIKHRERDGEAKWTYIAQRKTFNRRTGEKKTEKGQISFLCWHQAELQQFWDRSDLPDEYKPWNAINLECRPGFIVQLREEFRKEDHFEGELPEDGDFSDSEEETETVVQTSKDAEDIVDEDDKEEGEEPVQESVEGSVIEIEDDHIMEDDDRQGTTDDEGGNKDVVEGAHGAVDYSNPFTESVEAPAKNKEASVAEGDVQADAKTHRPKRKRQKPLKLQGQSEDESDQEKSASDVEQKPQKKKNRVNVGLDDGGEAVPSQKKIKTEKGIASNKKGKQRQSPPPSPPAALARRGSTIMEVVIPTSPSTRVAGVPRPVSRTSAPKANSSRSDATPGPKSTVVASKGDRASTEDTSPTKAASSRPSRETRRSNTSAPLSKTKTECDPKPSSTVTAKKPSSVATPSVKIKPIAESGASDSVRVRRGSPPGVRVSSSANIDVPMNAEDVDAFEEDEDDVEDRNMMVLDAVHKQHNAYVAEQEKRIMNENGIASSSKRHDTKVEISPAIVKGKDFMDAPGWRFRFITEALIPKDAMDDPQQGRLFKKHYLPKMTDD